MSVETTTRKVTQTMNELITEYTFTFRALVGSPADIKCIRETIADGTLEDMTYMADLPDDPTEADALKYSVEVNDDGIGGTITVAYAAAGVNDDTFKITIYRDTTDTQGSVYDDYNQFPAKTVESDFDRRTILSQEIKETLSRAITVPITEENPPDYASLIADAKEAAEDAATESGSYATISQSFNDSAESHATTALGHANDASDSADLSANYALGLQGTSTSEILIGLGEKVFTTQEGKQFNVGHYLLVVDTANSANYMFGSVTSYSGTTLTLEITATSGSGTISSWSIMVSGLRGLKGDPGTGTVSSGLDTNKSATPSEGDIYYATDTTKIYWCTSAEVWTEVKTVIDALTSTSSTFALSANQGKTLNDNKFDKSDVIDALTSTSSTNALSANQGKVLKVYVDDSSVTDHGALTGLGDDDHSQYHNDARAVTWHDADDHSGLSVSAAMIASSAISQAKLKTTTGAVSRFNGSGTHTLPGGSYGFYPQLKGSDTSSVYHASLLAGAGAAALTWDSWSSLSTSYVSKISLAANGETIYAQQRYVTSSGHDHWIFLLVDKETGKPISSYQAPDHPSANQGDATELDIPHPFGSYDPAKHEIVVVDNSELQEMVALKKQRLMNKERGVSLLQVINENYIIDNSKRPSYKPREIVKIDEEGTMEGEVIKTMKTPDWAKVMISNDEISLKRRMVEKLPDDILYKKLRAKK